MNKIFVRTPLLIIISAAMFGCSGEDGDDDHKTTSSEFMILPSSISFNGGKKLKIRFNSVSVADTDTLAEKWDTDLMRWFEYSAFGSE